MGELIRFELKKIITRKTTLFTCIAMFVALCLVMTMNILQFRTCDADDEVLSGLAGIAYERDIVNANAGVITPERVRDDISSYQELVFSKVSAEELSELSDEVAYSLMRERCNNVEYASLYDPYYTYLFSPWRQSGSEPYQTAAQLKLNNIDPASFYDQLSLKAHAAVDSALDPNTTIQHTEAEHAFWTSKVDEMQTPLVYGYAGGWEDILMCAGFLVFAITAICVALAPLFAGEYAERTDAVLLAARFGKNKLVSAKLIAALLFATAYYAICCAVIVVVPLACYGTQGADLPIQILSCTIPHNVSMAQSVALTLGAGYAITLGFAGLTIALSSRLRSQLAIFAVDVVLLFGTSMIGFGSNNLLAHLLYLFPIRALNPVPMFRLFLSYAAGPVVFDFTSALMLVWGVLALLCVPVAAQSFKHHQVV